MCGIVGYIGEKEANDLLISGLEKLEYRGYDSAGVAVISNNKINIKKKKGRVENLKSLAKLSGKIGKVATCLRRSAGRQVTHLEKNRSLLFPC